jgi:uncharacterized phage-associated protein
MHDSGVVANRFLKLAQAAGVTLTPMQLLKLVYIAHGWMLALYGRSLIGDEVQAWQYGPVIPKLYNKVRTYRGAPVTDELPARRDDKLDGLEEDLVDQVFRIYGRMSGPALSRITHASGTPWHRTYKPGEFGVRIPTDLIAGHYEHLAASGAESDPA